MVFAVVVVPVLPHAKVIIFETMVQNPNAGPGDTSYKSLAPNVMQMMEDLLAIQFYSGLNQTSLPASFTNATCTCRLYLFEPELGVRRKQ